MGNRIWVNRALVSLVFYHVLSYLHWSERNTSLVLNQIQQPLLFIFYAKGNLGSNTNKGLEKRFAHWNLKSDLIRQKFSAHSILHEFIYTKI